MSHRVGKYEVIERLSMGGMAELWLAVLPGPGGFRKVVALKQILPDVVRDEQFVKMFLDEARLTASLSHPNVAQVFELGHAPESGELYLAMEFVAGRTLFDVRERAAEHGGKLPFGFVCRVMRDALHGLHAAHACLAPDGTPSPVVHRDVSPVNVMVTFEGLVKVIDFGIAKAKGRLARTHVGVVKGTPGYMSPEQLRDEPLDARSDVFAAGVVLYELLSGQPLFADLPREELGKRFAWEQLPPLSRAAPHVPARLAEVVTRAVALDRNERWPTAKEFAHALEVASPEFFDEDSVGRTVRELFPDAVAATRELLVAAADAKADELTITRAVRALQRPNKLGPIPQAQGAEGPTAGRTDAFRLQPGHWVALGAVVLAGAIAAVLLNSGGSDASRRTPTPKALSDLEKQVMPQAEAALALHDTTRARQLLESCRIGDAVCPAAEKALAALPARPSAAQGSEPSTVSAAKCELDEARAQVRALNWEQATVLTRKCADGDGTLTAEARALLEQMQGAQGEWRKLRQVQQAIEAGQPGRARSLLQNVSPPPFLVPAVTELRQRLQRSAGTGGGSKEYTVTSGKATTAELLAEAKRLLARRQWDAARTLLEQCAVDQPTAWECHKLAGTTCAKLAALGNDDALKRAAAAHYRAYLVSAPSADPGYGKVRQLLDQYDASQR